MKRFQKLIQFLLLSAFIVFLQCKQPEVIITENDWFAFNPVETYDSSIIDMSSWLDKPAGKHGFVQIQEDKMVCEDGTPIKFWGTNICSQNPYKEKEYVDKWVYHLAKYGINGVRFHKYTYHGMKENISTELDPEKFDRFDYFQSRLKEAGIYYGWSPIYGHKLRPGDKDRVLAYNEIMNNTNFGSHLDKSTIGLVNFAEDLQQIHIELITGMLNHVNPYTGLKYADDPALAFVELQNEDDIWFATADSRINACPTYKKLITKKFTNWLRDKYQNQANLMKAWGQEAFEWGREVRNEDWNLDNGNITPIASHGIYTFEYNKYTEQGELLPTFLLDNATFLLDEQLAFYSKFEKAIRQTGYKGIIVGSCWQAGAGITHYYNLYADYITGMIDRHNYFGGGTGHRLIPGKFKNTAMVSNPGSGLIATGMQQVIDRPFSLSEWMSLPPNEWIAEGPGLIAFYGLGVQGWDASFAFATDDNHFTNTIHKPGVYNVTAPTQMAQYPALVSTIYNNDLLEGEVISVRNVHIKSLASGKLGFTEMVKQDWDQKSFESMIPKEAIAIGRAVVKFTDQYEETSIPDLSTNHDSLNKIIRSSTGQFIWDYSDKGFITVNTPSTQGIIGFAPENKITLNDIKIQSHSGFGIILISSLQKGKDIQLSDRLLITTVSRAKNTGMKFNEDKTEIIEVGEAPILLEPVVANIKFLNKTPSQINILDHTGKRTGEMLRFKGSKALLDGRTSHAIYYEVVF